MWNDCAIEQSRIMKILNDYKGNCPDVLNVKKIGKVYPLYRMTIDRIDSRQRNIQRTM